MTILRIADQRLFTESDLHVLLAEEGVEFDIGAGHLYLAYYSDGNGWFVSYMKSRLLSRHERFPLDPAKYQCIPDTCIRKEDVKAVYETAVEIVMGIYADYEDRYAARESLRSAFSRIINIETK